MSVPVVLRTRAELSQHIASVRAASVGFVPTMGALHAGHLSLVQRSVSEHSSTLVSVFVNPTQFGPNDDFHKYPRALERDLETLRDSGVAAVFAPAVSEVYPEGSATSVHVAGVSESLCGPWRPGHFDGVATVVAKLFSAVGPCSAYFGRKDFQQLAVILRMVQDLFLPVRVVGVPTLREPDGLAMSSRNVYLSQEERHRAAAIACGLRAAHAAFASGERSSAKILACASSHILPVATSVECLSLVDPSSLQPSPEQLGASALLAVAIRVGTTRLIDNVELGVDVSP